MLPKIKTVFIVLNSAHFNVIYIYCLLCILCYKIIPLIGGFRNGSSSNHRGSTANRLNVVFGTENIFEALL